MAESDARTRLRDAALELFGRFGVQATSTRAILEAAGMRNPSAISYHFGSKAGLIDDLVGEVLADAWPLVQIQIDLAANGTPSVEEWAGVAADSAAELVSTERGCLLARLLWEYDCVLHPDAFEEFLVSGHPAAIDWQKAIEVTPSALVSASAPGTPVLCATPLEPPPAHALATSVTAARPATSMPTRRDLFMGTPSMVRRHWWRNAGRYVAATRTGAAYGASSSGRARDETAHDEALAENNQGEGRQQ